MATAVTPQPQEWDATGQPIQSAAPPAASLSHTEWDASGNPISAQSAPAGSANPNGEGTYQMNRADGTTKAVPYSQVETAKTQGYKLQGEGQVFGPLTHKTEAARYASDHAADPNNPNPNMLDKIGNAFDFARAYGTGFNKAGAQTVQGVLKILGDQTSVNKNLPPGQQPQPESRTSQHIKAAADWFNKQIGDTETHGFWEGLGGFGENVAELMTPEALGELAKGGEIAKGDKGARAAEKVASGIQGAAEKYADASKVAKLLKDNPRIATLVGIGLTAAARGAAETGVQTYVKTGGDAGAAGDAAEMGAAAGGGLSLAGELVPQGVRAARAALQGGTKEIEGVEVPTGKRQALSPAGQDSAAQAYTATVRAATKPHLEAIGMNPGQVETYLKTFHDFSGAGSQLEKANDAVYNFFDQQTGGRFRTLNSEIGAARAAAQGGDAAAQAAYAAKVKEMDGLLDSTKGKVTPELVAATKASFRQSYILKDVGDATYKALDRLPGDAAEPKSPQTFNGNKFAKGLQKVTAQYGYEAVDRAMGPGRLKNLEAIADATSTTAKRQAFNFGVERVAEWLPAYLGYKAGEHIAGPIGGIGGAAAAEGAAYAAQRVMNAVLTDPRVGESLIYAVQYGASPQKYGPHLAQIISASISGANAQRAQGEK
jgi:hypothetical protein